MIRIARSGLRRVIVMMGLFGLGALVATPAPAAPAKNEYGKLPLHFEANQGQTSAQVHYLSRGPGFSLYLTQAGATLVLKKQTDRRKFRLEHVNATLEQSQGEQSGPLQSVLRVLPVGANAAARVTGEEQLPGRAHYFVGKDPARWRTNIPTYSKVHYSDIYPGIDLIFYGAQGQLEYDFVIAPGADPRAVRLRFTGADGLSLDRDGNLILQTAGGIVLMRAPAVYQEINGLRRDIAGRYVLDGKDQVSFRIGAYDASRPLVIDPVLFYSTYLGGIGDDFGNGVAVDAAGNAYVTGSTSSLDFPVSAPLQATIAGAADDVFVAKVNATGTALVYSTYLGGSENDVGIGIALDTNGNAYVTGSTASPDFPTAFPIQPALGLIEGSTGGDAFVVKLDPEGAVLVYSTYLGGSKDDIGQAIAVDTAGNAYVTGATASTDFPTATPVQGAFGGSSHPFGGDAFVTVLNPTGTAFVYSTYLGGSEDDFGTAIAVDSGGNAYVTGLTLSAGDFPTTGGAFQTAPRAASFADGFVAKLNPTGSMLVYSTFLSGNDVDQGFDIAVDASGNAYMTGFTLSADFPTAGTPVQPAFGGGTFTGDAFVTKLNAAGDALVYSTYLGGSGEDFGQGIALDAAANAYVTGATSSANFPTMPNPLQLAFGGGGNPFGGDAFVTQLNAAGDTLVYSSYLGGSGDDFGSDIAVDATGNAYVTGSIVSTNFPTVRPLQPKIGGGLFDAFLAKIAAASTPDLVTTQVSGPTTGAVGQSIAVTTTVENQGPANAAAFNIRLDLSTDPTFLAGVTSLGTRSVTSLAAGAASTATTEVPIPAIAFDTYYLRAVADSDGSIVELSENNNAKTALNQITITAFKPDLVANSVVGPDKGAPGLPLQLGATVVNRGPAAAGAFAVELYLSLDTVFDGPGTDFLLGSFNLATLASGARSSFTMTGLVPMAVPLASYHILAVADSNSAVPVDELDESNNVGVSTAQITITAAQPDLVVTLLTAPATGAPGNTVAVTTVVGNSGPSDAGTFTVEFYLSSDALLGGDTLLPETLTVASLAAATTTSATTTVTIPMGTAAGMYFLLAKADPDPTACPPGGPGAVAELDECNNVGATATKINITSFQPDLNVSKVTAPAKAGVGQNVEVTTTVENVGPADAGTFSVGLFFSTDGTIALTDTPLGNRVLTNLAAGAKATFTMTVQIPPGTTPGTYSLGAIADPAASPCGPSNPGGVAELDECNNSLAAAATAVTDFKPDLVLATLATEDVRGQLVSTDLSSTKGVGRVLDVSPKITNEGPAPVPAFVVEVYLSADAIIDPTVDRLLGRQTLPGLQSGEFITAVISGVVPPEFVNGISFPGSPFFVGVKVDPANLVDELLETNNDSTLSLDPKLAFIATLPDLEMTAFSGPKFGAAGRPITVTGTVTNNLEPAGTFTVGVYLSSDATFDPADIFVGRLLSVPSLGRGASTSGAATVTIPMGVATGLYNIIAVADPDNQLPEHNETNNSKVATIPPDPLNQIEIKQFKPDFVVKSVSGPAKGAVGQPLTMTVIVGNNGPAPSGPFTVGLYLSPDATIDPLTDIFLGNMELPSVDSDGIGGGPKKVTIPASVVPGLYRLGAFADPNNLIAETNGVTVPDGEANNGMAAPEPPIDIQLFTPDLRISSVSGPTKGAVGKTIEVTFAVLNDGQADAGPFTVGLYLSSDNTITTDDTFLGSVSLPSLKAGTSSSATTPVPIPVNTTPGPFFLGAIADPAPSPCGPSNPGAVAELDECNNASTTPPAITVQQLLPDLKVTAVSGPPKGAPGKPIDVTFTAMNDGTAPVGFFTVRLLLSSDGTIDLTDTLLGDVSVEGLEAGASATRTVTLPIPASIALTAGVGTYFFGAVADPDPTACPPGAPGAVAELDECNNAKAGNQVKITTKPDLTVTDVSAPASGFPGQPVVMTVTVENKSPAGAGAFTVGLYLSTPDSTITKEDRLLATLSFGSMDAGASSKTSTTVTLPSDLIPGNYFLGAFADPGASVDELDETNNAKASSVVKVTLKKPDLLVKDVVASKILGVIGQPLAVTTDVENLGSVAAGPFTVGLFLAHVADINEGAFIDPARDRFLGVRSVASLAAGADEGPSSINNMTVTIPADVVPGDYFIGAFADLGKSIDESDETNNSRTAPLKIIPFKPDLTVPAVIGPPRAGAGQSVSVSVTVSNSGPAAASSVSVGIYLSPIGVPDPLKEFTFKAGTIDPVKHRLLGAPVSIGSVATNATVTKIFTVTIPKDVAPDPYFLGAFADPGGLVDELNEANNGSFALNFITITPALPDLTMSLKTVPSVGSPGKPLSVTHTVTNRGTAAAGAFAVKLFLSQSSSLMPPQDWFLGSAPVGGLAANGILTTTTTVTIPPDVPPGAYNLEVRANPDGRIVELDETNNGDTKLIEIKPFLPDLTVTSVSGPAKAAVSRSVSVTATVKNEGAADATTPFSVAMYLSTDLQLDASDRFLGNLPVASLKAGASFTSPSTFVVGIPPDLPPGTYFLVAVADSATNAVESDETNNVKFSSGQTEITPFLPDLVVTGLTGPSTGNPGKPVNLTTTVLNQGPANAAASTVGLFLSTDNVIDPAMDRFLGSRVVPALAVNGTSAASTSVTIPADVEPGSYFLGAVADSGTSVAEVDETNNTKDSTIQVKLLLPDLVVTQVSAPATGAAGQKITVANTVQNQGLASAAAFTVGFYLSPDNVIDQATDRFLGSRLLSSLAVNGTSVASTPVTIPADVEPGSYFIGVVADATNNVAEQDDSNNTKVTAPPTVITLFKPDLVVTAVSGPAKGVVGANISVSTTVRNQGPAPVTGPFTVGVYLSSGKVVDPAMARFLGSRSIPSLGAGALNTAAVLVTIPADVAPGAYFIGAVADPAASLDELDKINNALAAADPIQITLSQPDLVMTAVSTTATRAVPGSTISVSSTVRNQGPAPAVGPFTVSLYLSTDAFFDAADQFLANRPPLASLAAGASSAATTSAMIPMITPPGSYFILAVADPSPSVVTELDETNNTLVTIFPIQVTANQPDLVVTTVSGPASGVLGKSITVTATVKNQGPAAAGAFSVGFYLSADPLIDPAADALLGTVVPVASLAAGASTTLTKTAAIPVASSGLYFIGAVADPVPPAVAPGAVTELDEANNARAALNRITISSNLPDLVVTVVSVPSTGAVGQTKPIPGIVGKTLTVTTTVKNQGPAAAGAFTVSVYRSDDPVFDAGDLLLGTRNLTSLAAGGVSTGTITTSLLPGQPGSYFLLAVADSNSPVPVAEQDETNNVKPLASVFPIKPNLPDLVMTAVSGPFQQAVGKTISVSNTVKNQGSAAAGSFTIQFTLEPGGFPLAGGTRTVTSLGVGATNTASTTVTIPLATSPGDYFLAAVADSGLSITEQDETNNGLFAFLPIRITDNQPDLIVTAVSGPVTGAVGKTIAVTNVVENQGHAAAGSSRVDFYLSVDNLFSTAGDNFQLTGSRTLSLAAGAISSAVTTVTIPPAVPTGPYFIIAVADAANAVPTELDENNNTRASLTQITITADKPDLVITAVSGPATGTVGKTISVPNTMRNQGLKSAGSSRIDFYLSVDNLFTTPGDNFQLTGSRTVSSLAAGTNSVGITTVTIPAIGLGAVPKGTYYLLAIADAGLAVLELDDTNNSLASDRQIVVTPDLPDLVMAVVAGPTVGVAGMTIPVNTTVVNSGSKSAAASQVTFFLRPVTPGADILLAGSRTVAILAAKASSAGTTTVTIPPGVAPGDYHVGAIVDQAGAVTEIEEVTNNALAAVATMTVLPNVARTYATSVGKITESGCLNPLLDGNGNFNTTLTIAPHTGVSFSGTAAGTIVLPSANATFDETMTISGTLIALDKLAGTFTVTTKQGAVFVGSGSGTFSGSRNSISGALDLVFEGQDVNGVTCKFIRTITINP